MYEKDLPQISNYSNATYTYSPDSLTACKGIRYGTSAIGGEDWLGTLGVYAQIEQKYQDENKKRQEEKHRKVMADQKKPTRRLIRVLIADSDESVPLDKAVLFKGDEQLTDLTDEELFLEIGIKPLLDKHNETRLTIVDKKASAKAGKEIYLEPIRIRDLRMVVSTIAEF